MSILIIHKKKDNITVFLTVSWWIDMVNVLLFDRIWNNKMGRRNRMVLRRLKLYDYIKRCRRERYDDAE